MVNAGNINKIIGLILDRNNKRIIKDYNSADNIREKLHNLGVIIEDLPNGIRFKFKNKHIFNKNNCINLVP